MVWLTCFMAACRSSTGLPADTATDASEIARPAPATAAQTLVRTGFIQNSGMDQLRRGEELYWAPCSPSTLQGHQVVGDRFCARSVRRARKIHLVAGDGLGGIQDEGLQRVGVPRRSRGFHRRRIVIVSRGSGLAAADIEKIWAHRGLS